MALFGVGCWGRFANVGCVTSGLFFYAGKRAERISWEALEENSQNQLGNTREDGKQTKKRENISPRKVFQSACSISLTVIYCTMGSLPHCAIVRGR